MKTISISEAKMRLSALLDSIGLSDEGALITKNGPPAGVLVSADAFESWRETLAIRCDSELIGEIRKGADALRRKKASLYTLDELFQ